MTMSRVAKIVSFRLGADFFAVDIFAVERVLRYQPPTAVPTVPAWIEGVLEYHGRVVPVVDLRRRFELPRLDPTPETRILVLKSAGEWVAVVVDAALEVIGVEESLLSPPPPIFRGLASEYLRGIVRLRDRLLMCLDVERLLSSDDRIVLERVGADALPHG
jgi:purine-binding chemotaxis protein CheW